MNANKTVSHADDVGDDEVLAQMLEEITRAIEAGNPVDLAEYKSRYPQYRERIREIFPAVQALGELGLSLVRSSVSGKTAFQGTREVSASGTLGDFRILCEIGRGGMGIVYEAEQISLGRRVALKVLPFAAVLDPRQLQRFQNEARAAATLRHRNVVQVFAVGCERGVHFYAMEFIEGRTLADVIGQLRQLPDQDRGEADTEPIAHGAAVQAADPWPWDAVPDESPRADTDRITQAAIDTDQSFRGAEFYRTVARLGVQAAEALDHAHQMGVVHRDVKPSNLLLDTTGNLWISDFGLAQMQTGDHITMTGDVLGTLRYMSPEQAQGNRRVLDHHTDIYSLGVTLYELLTLEPPFAASDRHALIHQIIDGEPRRPRQRNAAIPSDLETIVLKAIAAEPANRYATAQALADDLGRFLADEPVQARRPSLPERASKWGRRHRPIVWSSALSVSVVLMVLLVSTFLVLGAYQSEKRQRDIAEDNATKAQKNYVAAREAVKQMLTRVADEQLGAIPEMKDVRCRLLEDAVAFYTELLKLNPRDAVAYFERGQVYFLLARYQAAQADYEKAVELDPENAPFHRRLAAFFCHGGCFGEGCCPDVVYRDPKRSLVHVKRAVEIDPQNIQYWILLSDAYASLGAIGEAKKLLQKLADGPRSCWDLYNIGRAYLQMGDTTAALLYFQKIVVDHPAIALFHLRLAEALAKAGEREQALAAANTVLKLKDANPWIYHGLAGLFASLGDNQKELAAAKKAIEIYPKLNDLTAYGLYGLRGDAYTHQGMHAAALADFDKSVGIAPFRSYTYKRRAYAQFQLKNYDQALADIAKAVELKPDDVSNLTWLPPAEVATCPDEALREGLLELAGKTLQRTNGSAQACAVWGRLWNAFGRPDKAFRVLQQLAEKSPEVRFYLHARRVGLYMSLSQVEEAIESLSEAIRRKPADAENYFRRALAYASKGELGRSIEDLYEALRRNTEPAPVWLPWVCCALPVVMQDTEKLPGIVFVSDMPWVRSTCGWKSMLGWGPSEALRDDVPNQRDKAIAALPSGKFVWTNSFEDASPADVVPDLAGQKVTAFKAQLRAARDRGTVQFQVLLDGKVMHETQMMRFGELQTVNIDVTNAKEVVLRVLNGGDGGGYDCAVWGFARFVQAGAEDPLEVPPAQFQSTTHVNAAFFLAQVHWRLDHKDLARRWYDKAAEWMDKNPTAATQLEKYRAEAARALGIPAVTPAVKEKTAKPQLHAGQDLSL